MHNPRTMSCRVSFRCSRLELFPKVMIQNKNALIYACIRLCEHTCAVTEGKQVTGRGAGASSGAAAGEVPEGCKVCKNGLDATCDKSALLRTCIPGLGLLHPNDARVAYGLWRHALVAGRSMLSIALPTFVQKISSELEWSIAAAGVHDPSSVLAGLAASVNGTHGAETSAFLGCAARHGEIC